MVKFVEYTKTDTYYEFITENGNKVLMPLPSVILVDDESGAVAVKNTASRRTIGYVVKEK